MKRAALAVILVALAPLAFGQADDTGALPVRTPDRSTTCTLGSLNAACTVIMEGRQGVGGYVTIGTLNGTITPEVLVDGSTWVPTSFLTWAAGASPTRVATITTTALFQVEIPAGTKQARIRVSAYVSGSGTGTLIATEAPGVQKASAAGNDTEVQFNDAGSLAGDTDLIWNKTTNKLTVGVAANSFYAKPTATDFSDNFLRSVGTLTRDGTPGVIGAEFRYTVDPSALVEYGQALNVVIDGTANTNSGTFIEGVGGSAQGSSQALYVRGMVAQAFGDGIGIRRGIEGLAIGGLENEGGYFTATVAKDGGANIGVGGLALNTGTTPVQIGGFFALQSTNPTLTSAALLADNGATTSPIFLARDNGTPVFTIADGGTTTMTAPLLAANGAVANPSFSFSASPGTGITRASGGINFGIAGSSVMMLRGSDVELLQAAALGWNSVGGNPGFGGGTDLRLFRDAANTLAQRLGTNAQTVRWYGTFTDASNYTRAAVNTTSTTVTFAAETAGTGADDIDVTLSPAGTGSVTVPAQKSICLQDAAGGDEYCINSETTAPAGTTQLALNIDPATCTGDGNGGALTIDGSNNIICSADAGGAGSGLLNPEVLTRVSYGGF